ncbi:exonuclease SbcCD subunit D [Rugosimonospora acidiphila]|uniref:Nuclease SbcCD subunit D n=1 Tax=Rugosimonospora acidiphila TaxID=556531 RepID=A0ABP9RND7_9ACTN
MRILHTSDWHIGKVLKGQSRVEEHIAVLRQLVDIAREQRPDLVVVAGDLYDTAVPTPDATRLVTRALSALRGTGADVVAIAGNHDNGAALDALRAWADAAGIVLRGTVRDRPDDHIVTGQTRDGEPWRLVALPFLSQRYAIRATEMFDLSAAEATQTYADHVGRLLRRLSEGFGGDTVNLVTAHLTVIGGTMGGGERDAHTIQAYAVPTTVFSPATHYVALGHLHRAQSILGPCPVHYSGAPLQVDFGEEENVSSVTMVEVGTSSAARTRQVPVAAAVPLRTVRGTLDELSKVDGSEGWLRVYVRERPRAGLREAVQELLPRALEVRIDPALVAELAESGQRGTAQRTGRAPGELFADYLTSRGHADPAVSQLFDRLYGEVRTS